MQISFQALIRILQESYPKDIVLLETCNEAADNVTLTSVRIGYGQGFGQAIYDYQECEIVEMCSKWTDLIEARVEQAVSEYHQDLNDDDFEDEDEKEEANLKQLRQEIGLDESEESFNDPDLMDEETWKNIHGGEDVPTENGLVKHDPTLWNEKEYEKEKLGFTQPTVDQLKNSPWPTRQRLGNMMS